MKDHQTIYIVGAGAIGKALAANLIWSNKEVILIRANVDNQPSYQENIQLTDGTNMLIEAEITITTFSNLPNINGIVVITAKSYSNHYIANQLLKYNGDFPVVLMQNGLNIEQSIKTLVNNDIYRCVLYATSQFQDDGKITFKPVAPSLIGIVRETHSKLQYIVSQIHTNGFQFAICHDIQHIVWEKTITNCVFNSLCPLLETDNGIFHRNKNALDLAKKIIQECVSVAKAYNINLEEKTVIDKLLKISVKTEHQLISTFQDIKKGRRTEIESLNLEVARLAIIANKNNMVHLTKSLGEIITLRSDLSREIKNKA